MISFYKISYQWLPVYDKYRYRPLSVSVDFLQNVFDIVFLLAFIWYWNWGPLLVVLYYVVETLVSCLFTAMKWWKSKANSSDDRIPSTPAIKRISIITLCSVVAVFSYAQISAVHDLLGIVLTVPSWEMLVADEKQFMIGVLAIVLQQIAEYYKFHLQSKHAQVELVHAVLTPVLRIFIQQLSVMLGILAVLLLAFSDLKSASVVIALMSGLVKLIMGQFQFRIKK